eukprot:5321153-Amphidinium_carterae.1
MEKEQGKWQPVTFLPRRWKGEVAMLHHWLRFFFIAWACAPSGLHETTHIQLRDVKPLSTCDLTPALKRLLGKAKAACVLTCPVEDVNSMQQVVRH